VRCVGLHLDAAAAPCLELGQYRLRRARVPAGHLLVTISNINPSQIGQTITLPVRLHAHQEQILGPDHPSTITVRYNLATAQASQG